MPGLNAFLRFCSAALGLTLLLAPSLRAEFGLVARTEVHLEGRVEGRVRVLSEDARVTLEPGARIEGELVLPQSKGLAAKEGRPTVLADQVSSRFSLLNRAGASAVASGQRSLPSVGFPMVEPPARPVSRRDLDLGGRDDSPIRDARRVTLRSGTRLLVPGAYGSITLTGGTLRLGEPNRRTRYDMESLDVESGGEILLEGPVVLTIGAGAALAGKIGHPGRPQWLDLRISSGTLRLAGGAEVHGFVTGPTVKLEMGSGARVVGGALVDQANVAAGALIIAIAPGNPISVLDFSGPLFVHKALRLQDGFAALGNVLPARFETGLSYEQERPVLVLSERGRATHRTAQTERNRAFFIAAACALDGTGFDDADILLVRASEPGSPGSALQMRLPRRRYDEAIWALTREADPRIARSRILNDPLLQNLFLERCLTATGSSWKTR